MLTRSLLAALLLSSLSLLPGATIAAETGETLTPFSLEDQAGKTHTLDTSIRRIYATGDRKSAALFKDAMAQRDQQTLDAQQAIVIAEISEAPGFVRRMIRSGLSDRPYSTWVDTRGSTRRLLPYRPDRVAVIDLANLQITAIRHHADIEAVIQELTPAP